MTARCRHGVLVGYTCPPCIAFGRKPAPLTPERVAELRACDVLGLRAGFCSHPPHQPDPDCSVCQVWLEDNDWAELLGLDEPGGQSC